MMRTFKVSIRVGSGFVKVSRGSASDAAWRLRYHGVEWTPEDIEGFFNGCEVSYRLRFEDRDITIEAL